MAEHATLDQGQLSDIPHLLATNRYGTYCIPNAFKKRQVPKILRAGQVYEADTLAFLRRHIGHGDIVTGGAFVGDFFPALHEVLDPEAQLHSFEPFPLLFDAAGHTMALNGLDRVRLHRCAVGRSTGTAQLATARADTKASLAAGMHITNEPDTGLETIPVPVIPIDDLVPADRHVSVLHLDVEGFENDALHGAWRLLSDCKPIVVLEGDRPYLVRAYIETLNEVAPKAGYVHAGCIDENAVLRAIPF